MHYNKDVSSRAYTKEVKMTEMSKSAKIKQLHEQGMSCAQIARELGIRYQFVYNVLKQNSLDVRTSDRSAFSKSSMIKTAYKQYGTVRAAADAVGVSYQFAYNVLSNARMLPRNKK